jgi:hypothetical protein
VSRPPDIVDLAARPGVMQVEHVGSRVTCDPPPTDTDDDWLILGSPSGFRGLQRHLESCAFSRGGSDIDHQPASGFLSYKYGEVNVILTDDRNFFEKFMAASSVAKRFNLLDKSDRIALFRAVLYSERCDGDGIEAFS